MKSLYHNADIAIFGGGIIGIFFAYLLSNSKYRVIVVDRGRKNLLYQDEKRTLLKGIKHNSSQLTNGFGLGGKSSLWGGQLSELNEYDLSKSFWGLKFKDLKKYYEKVYKILKINCNNRIKKNKKFKLNFFYTYFLKQPDFYKLFINKLRPLRNKTNANFECYCDTLQSIICYKTFNNKIILDKMYNKNGWTKKFLNLIKQKYFKKYNLRKNTKLIIL